MRSPQRVRFTDPDVQAAVGPFLDGSQTWERFFAAAEALSGSEPGELVRMQTALVEAVVAGRYSGVPRSGAPVRFLDEDGTLPGGMAFGAVVSHDDDLAFALAHLDERRVSSGERAARRWIRSIAEGEGTGYSGDVRLLTLLPRAYRLRTGSAMPGYRAYWQEERAAPGARDEVRLVVLEVEHDGVPGLISIELAAYSSFHLDDGVARAVRALQAAVPFTVVMRHLGAAVKDTTGPSWRQDRDGILLFRSVLAAPQADERWVEQIRRALLVPRRAGRPLPAADVWSAIADAGPGDVDMIAESLAELLATRSPARIRAFDSGLRILLGALDRPEVLGAASESFGWLSDDAWEDVRLGVLALGAEAHAAALRDPAAFDWAEVEPGEVLLSAASDAHEVVTGERLEPDIDATTTAGEGAVVLSVRPAGDGPELCIRWWADAATARDRHRAAEGDAAEVLAARPELARGRVKEGFQGAGPVALL